MICGKCRGGTHSKCANITRTSPCFFLEKHGSWCDCQHQPGTSLSIEAISKRDDSLGVARGETSSAPVHIPA